MNLLYICMLLLIYNKSKVLYWKVIKINMNQWSMHLFFSAWWTRKKQNIERKINDIGWKILSKLLKSYTKTLKRNRAWPLSKYMNGCRLKNQCNKVVFFNRSCRKIILISYLISASDLLRCPRPQWCFLRVVSRIVSSCET